MSTICPQHYPPTDFQRRFQTTLFNNFPISFFLRSFFSSQFFRSISSFIKFSAPINLHLFSFVHQNLSSDLIIREIKSNELSLFSFCSLLIYTCTFACNKIIKNSNRIWRIDSRRAAKKERLVSANPVEGVQNCSISC